MPGPVLAVYLTFASLLGLFFSYDVYPGMKKDYARFLAWTSVGSCFRPLTTQIPGRRDLPTTDSSRQLLPIYHIVSPAPLMHIRDRASLRFICPWEAGGTRCSRPRVIPKDWLIPSRQNISKVTCPDQSLNS